MNNILEKLNSLEINIYNLKKLRDGETSDTYIGLYKNKKTILKILKTNNNAIKTNSYLDKKIYSQLVNKKLFPEVLYRSPSKEILIYEYFKSLPIKKDKLFIEKLGRQIKKIHQIKVDKRTHTFEKQIEQYKKIIKDSMLESEFKSLIEFLNISYEHNYEIAFSHNDLNKNNILFNNNICFIDYEYASINNIFCDISRVIDEYKLEKHEINYLLEGYGIINKSSSLNQIKIWKKINLYLDYIWEQIIKQK
tara:strand:+ start:34 stop:783 length:750 start_codon:yes stop_codon:yes gene_type:complete